MGTHYDTLGLSPTASDQEIEDQYRALAKVVHPDLGGDAVMFMVLNEAYEVLTDPVRRTAYDRALRADVARTAAQSGTARTGRARGRAARSSALLQPSTPDERALGERLAERGILSWHQTPEVYRAVRRRRLKRDLLWKAVAAVGAFVWVAIKQRGG